METTNDFQGLAASWHGGQWTSLYAFSSTGTVTEGLSSEIAHCVRIAQEENMSECEIEQLKSFLEWAETEEAKKFSEES